MRPASAPFVHPCTSDYSHRKQWVIDRLQELSYVYSIDTCAYAVMSNHYHLVLFIDIARALGWSDEEVARRWKKLFCIPPLVQRYLSAESISRAERDAARDIIATWRARLMDISWFMKSMNEHLARRANLEDGVTGRFWEGRFKSQALLDEPGLLTAMAYVDLNPIRAGIAATPESSEFTSIYERIQRIKKQPTHSLPLRKFVGQASKERTLPCSEQDYLALLDWTGRAIRGDQHGHIDQALPPILTRLNIDPAAWAETMQPQGNVFGRAMGQLDHLRLHAKALGQSWVRGLRQAERMYRTA
jgi:REP element-mobilizing transposase RayT